MQVISLMGSSNQMRVDKAAFKVVHDGIGSNKYEGTSPVRYRCRGTKIDERVVNLKLERGSPRRRLHGR
jgi:hypothetical protein